MSGYFSVNFTQIFSLIVQATYTSILEDDNSSEYSYDSDDEN